MPRAPATRDQADAYRFGLRRLEAALVRGDPVLLHEQLRTSRRAAFVGVLVGMVGLCGVAAWGLVAPRPDWRHQAVVTGAASGAMYVVAHDPDRLVPVADLLAARLVLAALGQDRPGAARAVAVSDEDLATAPRTPTSAVVGAVAVAPEQTVAARWAVCDRVRPDGALTDTTVIGGAVLPPPAAPADGVLLAGPDDTEWLVTGGQRHRVDIGDGAVRAAYRLTDRLPRSAAPALLSLLPEGAPIRSPQVSGRGRAAPAGLPGEVGDVLVDRSGDAGDQFWVVLAGGVQQVPRMMAQLLAVAAARPMLAAGPDVLGPAPLVAPADAGALAVDGWPDGPVHLVEPDTEAVTCWTWTPERPSGDVWFGAALPLSPGVTPVTLAQADGGGDRIDAVAVGAGGAVRATGPGRAAGAGPLWLVSASGVGYGIADRATAAALGVDAVDPAPEGALALLPAGPPVDLAAARRTVDVLPGG